MRLCYRSISAESMWCRVEGSGEGERRGASSVKGPLEGGLLGGGLRFQGRGGCCDPEPA